MLFILTIVFHKDFKRLKLGFIKENYQIKKMNKKNKEKYKDKSRKKNVERLLVTLREENQVIQEDNRMKMMKI